MDVPSRRSLDTTASGLNAESIISLSAFPGTPVSTDFNPSVFRRQLPSLPTSRSSQRGSPQPSNSDWHDGASSISRGRVDSTIPGVTASFIQNAMSDEQDARSEITYPPLSPPQTQYAPSSRSSRRPPPLRLPSDGGDPPAMKTGGSTPNTAPRSALTASEEDASIAAAHHGSIHRDIRTNSVTKSLGLQGAEVVGVAPATIVQTLSRRSSQPLSHRQSGYLSKLPSHREEPPDDIPDDISQHSESGRSYVPSFISSSAHSLRRVLNRYSRYGRTPSPAPPLPPNPNIPASYKSYETYFFQNGSTSNLPFLGKRDPTSPAVAQSTANSLHVWPPAARNSGFSPLDGHPLDSPKVRESSTRGRKKKIIILSVVILALVVTGIVVGVVVSLKNKVASAASSCANGLAGADCSMNATCVCTSSSSRCDGLSQNLVDLIPTVNQLFQTNYSQSEVYSAVWASVGSSKNCISQANVVDLAPALTKAKSPNRLEFAQSAILWNLVESQDLTSAQKLRSFIVNAPWATLTSSDGTQDGTNGSFGTTISGFNFDFASQKVSPPSISFVSSASPSSEQLSRIAPGARDVLDRMYSVARASATQHKVALNTYWTGTLQQNSDDLKTFLSAFLNSPILLPFDSQSDDMLNLMQHNQSSSFPPPLACSPSLNSTKLDRVNHLESTVFALPNVTTAKSYSADCYPSRPTYGRLDVLQLRLPFSDQEGGDKLPKQALALKRDAGSRVVVYPWNINSALLASDPGSALSSTQTDYRQYGTLNSAEHVVLAYLQSIGDVNLAMSFIKFLLQDTRAPPPTDFALDRMPIIEVAIFGTLDRSDFTSATTAFSTKSGGVFFGSSDSGTLRDWANSANLPIFWAEKAGSTQVVRQTSSPPQAFSDAWKASSDSLKNDIDVTIKQITDSLSSTGQFTAAYGFG